MKKTNESATRFTVDFFEKKIFGTKASFNKASKGTGDAYKELTRLMNAHPDFKLVEKEQKKRIHRAKRDYNGMDFKFMEEYIKYVKNNDELLMNEYKRVKDFAKAEGISKYPFTKKWFINKFGEINPETGKKFFDMEKANEAISNGRVATVEATPIPFIANKAEDKIGA